MGILKVREAISSLSDLRDTDYSSSNIAHYVPRIKVTVDNLGTATSNGECAFREVFEKRIFYWGIFEFGIPGLRLFYSDSGKQGSVDEGFLVSKKNTIRFGGVVACRC